MRQIGRIATGLLVVAVSCGGGTSDPTVPAASLPSPSTQLTINAPQGSSESGFAETRLAVPADTSFTVRFVNDDEGIPHNVQFFEGSQTSGTPIWAPENDEMIVGIDEVTYDVPALPAGTYAYNCFAHPVTMIGILEAV